VVAAPARHPERGGILGRAGYVPLHAISLHVVIDTVIAFVRRSGRREQARRQHDVDDFGDGGDTAPVPLDFARKATQLTLSG